MVPATGGNDTSTRCWLLSSSWRTLRKAATGVVTLLLAALLTAVLSAPARATEGAPLVTGTAADAIGPGHSVWTVQQSQRGETTPREVYQLADYRALPSDLPAGTVVMYDLETWSSTLSWTPAGQYTHPRRSELRFVSLAHAAGYRAMLGPHMTVIDASIGGCHRRSEESVLHAYLRCLANVPADYFVVQAQAIECHRAAFIRRIRLVHAVQPGAVIAETSVTYTKPCVTANKLAGDIQAVVPTYAAGAAVWGLAFGTTVPLGRPLDEQAAMIEAILAAIA
jgi:hypothetical protein